MTAQHPISGVTLVQTIDAAHRLGIERDAFLKLAEGTFTKRTTPGGARFLWLSDELDAYLLALARRDGTEESAKLAVLEYRRSQER